MIKLSYCDVILKPSLKEKWEKMYFKLIQDAFEFYPFLEIGCIKPPELCIEWKTKKINLICRVVNGNYLVLKINLELKINDFKTSYVVYGTRGKSL